MWYCAHAVFYYKCGTQDSFLVHENVYLINADNSEDALEKAKRMAKSNEDVNEDGHLELNGQQAQYLCAGIRKIIEIELNPETAQGKLSSGIEVTYSVMEVDTFEEVNALASGDILSVLYRE